MFNARLAVLLALAIFSAGCTSNSKPDEQSPDDKKSVADVIPLTMANMRGHEALYDEGWFVITSSKQALNYAKEKSVISSREAVTLAANSIAQRDDTLADELAHHWKLSADLGKQTFQSQIRP